MERESEDPGAWRKGALAYAANVPRHRNPYPAEFASADSRLSWEQGYDASELAHNTHAVCGRCSRLGHDAEDCGATLVLPKGEGA